MSGGGQRTGAAEGKKEKIVTAISLPARSLQVSINLQTQIPDLPVEKEARRVAATGGCSAQGGALTGSPCP